MGKFYAAIRTAEGLRVYADTAPLAPRHDLRNHSPTGFEHGYCGSGPSQLSLALLADALGNDEQALAAYQDFKADVIAKIPNADASWHLTAERITSWFKQWETAHAARS